MGMRTTEPEKQLEGHVSSISAALLVTRNFTARIATVTKNAHTP
jgi:hypothetical protein